MDGVMNWNLEGEVDTKDVLLKNYDYLKPSFTTDDALNILY